MKILVCVTASFPYGNKETFFANELVYLSTAFDKVIILPLYNPFPNNEIRKVPENVTVLKPVIPRNKLLRFINGIGFNSIDVFCKEFIFHKVYKSKYRTFRLLNSYLNFQHYSKVFKKIINENDDFLIYSYWAEASFFLDNKLSNAKKIVRMHRTDFYVEVNNNYLPLRKSIYEKADLLLPISDDIAKRLQSQYLMDNDKIKINRLGVKNNISPDVDIKISDEIVIVSCSRVDAIKRVLLLFDILKSYEGSRIIVWHHFGDGDEFSELKQGVEQLNSSKIKVKLHGWCSQKYIFDFYNDNKVHWFINVSLHEGIPVSIMEAMSFSVPVIATDAGATREIVNGENGLLLPINFDSKVLLNCIEDDEKYKDKRANAYETWKNKYNSDTNYYQLIKTFKGL